MKKIYFIILLGLIIFLSCADRDGTTANSSEEIDQQTEMVVDSLLNFKQQSEETDILSRRFPELSREKAIAIQLAMLKKELDSGARQIGWKMGGTVAEDSAGYDPMFGYMLESDDMTSDNVITTKNFPGGRAMVEAEIGFVINRDFKNGANSLKEVIDGIDYVINAVEFAQDIAIPVKEDPESKTINHTLAAGMGHAGILLGSGKTGIEDIDVEEETAKCFINNKLIAEGKAENIYRGPLNALYSLINLLPEHEAHVKKGDIIITGSLYENPTIDSTADIRLEFSTLGNIEFQIAD